MELHDGWDAFAERSVKVVAVAQEDETLEGFARFQGAGFEPEPRFELVADLGRTETRAWDRTTAYLLDEDGVVRQVFPMLIHFRPTWEAVLSEIDRLQR